MIVIRLYLLRRRTTKALGPRHAVHYISIIAILVESAALMDIMLLFFIIPFALGNPVANIPLSSMVQIQVRKIISMISEIGSGNNLVYRLLHHI